MLPLLLAMLSAVVPVQYAPVRPTVGDRIELRYDIPPGGRLKVRPSPQYEIVGTIGNRVTLRSFRPGKFVVLADLERDGVGRRSIRGPEITVQSVLAPNDSMRPAPLAPPRGLAPDRAPLATMAAAALVAAMAWLGVVLFARRQGAPLLSRATRSPREEFLEVLNRLRRSPKDESTLVELGDAVRRYLARSEGKWGRELTTLELTRAMAGQGIAPAALSSVREILLQADLAKFSPWGPRNREFDRLIESGFEVLELGRQEAVA